MNLNIGLNDSNMTGDSNLQGNGGSNALLNEESMLASNQNIFTAIVCEEIENNNNN